MVGEAQAAFRPSALAALGRQRRVHPQALSDVPLPPHGARVVYIFRALEFPYLKVGSTRHLRTRIASLRWSVPGGMRIMAWWAAEDVPLVLEAELQARLDRWACGGEWFRLDAESGARIAAWMRFGLPPALEWPDGVPYKATRRMRAHFVRQLARAA